MSTDQSTPTTTRRVVGSGFTVLQWNGKDVAFLERVRDSGQSPIQGTGPEAIYPLNKRQALEIATPRVLGMGTLTMELRESWTQPAWQELDSIFENANDLIDVYEAVDNLETPLTAKMVFRLPNTRALDGRGWRMRTYHNLIITSIDDSEDVTVGAMTVSRSITAAYTHKTHATMDSTGPIPR